jgi:hypothetical protein
MTRSFLSYGGSREDDERRRQDIPYRREPLLLIEIFINAVRIPFPLYMSR